jgi:hypothetical protein
VRDCRETGIAAHRDEQYDNARPAREEKRDGSDNEPECPGDYGKRDTEGTTVPDTLDEPDGGQLYQFCKRRYGSQQADDGVGGTEGKGEGDEEDAARQGHHRLGRESVPYDGTQSEGGFILCEGVADLEEFVMRLPTTVVFL